MAVSGDAQRRSAARVVADRGTMATTLVALFVDEFGEAGLYWHPATIRLEVEDTFGVAMPDASYARLMAGISLVVGDEFYKKLPSFIVVANTLSGHPPDGVTFDVAEAEEVAWAITEALLLGPPDEDEPFVGEILRYIGKVLDREGILDPPDVLAIAVRDDKDGLRRAMADFADDPALISTIREVEAAKTREINDIVLDGLHRLIEQLGALNLKTGDASALLGRLQARTK